ncbi:MAG TPA: SufD family Fe-S cluster assembly protein [Firmicutes bacterium]|nr:SufD family Fe-S cluster assembly protein [Bacillota bacterium]
MLNVTDKKLLAAVADLHEIPQGAFNIRKNGEGIMRRSTANIEIVPKDGKPGIDILVKPGTKNESVHIPVILSAGLQDVVYNTFEIGAGSDVLVVAGCGIHNPDSGAARHDGVHEFFVRTGAKMKYVEKHYGEGKGGERILNPKTVIEVEEGGVVELEMIQLRGVDRTLRDTEIRLQANSRLIVTERLLTGHRQEAESKITVELLGDDATAQIISRSVARDDSRQLFHLNLRGYARCRGHIQCDSIIMHNARVSSVPEISAYHADAALIHEAAIGKIASEQLLKLMTLGLSEAEAEAAILEGFLK